jgi:septal ring factor EnvC (AmiA/AmiB activator)
MKGFIDLRHAGGAESIHDSFWPSFTEVMMVVVMIFLMASLILVVRNWDLVAELRATIRAEREPHEIAQSTNAANKTLAERLAQVQRHLSELQSELTRVSQESSRKSRLIDERDKSLHALEADVRNLSERLRSSERTAVSLSHELAQVRTALT